MSQNGVKCDEYELKKACNQLINYADFLDRKRLRFSAMLEAVQRLGIKDDLISARLTEISVKAESVSRIVSDNVERILSNITAEELSAIEASDDFSYPNSFMDEVYTLLTMFFRG